MKSVTIFDRQFSLCHKRNPVARFCHTLLAQFYRKPRDHDILRHKAIVSMKFVIFFVYHSGLSPG